MSALNSARYAKTFRYSSSGQAARPHGWVADGPSALPAAIPVLGRGETPQLDGSSSRTQAMACEGSMTFGASTFRVCPPSSWMSRRGHKLLSGRRGDTNVCNHDA
jgi:hypothetical protein